ncbi:MULTISPECIES: hypothetical protein [unclassified Bradyrhizobium]|uniref:hypothetical protein n=1 Tax=unclassified Bradyrhizobium TaxID=2631580 RepID=UPI0028EF243C|nr:MULTISPECIES: hypothetical protein [unclassified Bradyrhizobium]
MSRSGYSEDCDDDQWGFIRYRGMVASATRGKRGQSLFRDILIGMNGMICKRLIADELEQEGAVCAIGAAGKVRGVDMSSIDPEDSDTVAGKFDIADCLAREIVWMNDECGSTGEWLEDKRRWRRETPEDRFNRMRKWVRSQITDPLFDVVWC